MHGLPALVALHEARRGARFDDGEIVLLADQDRALWDGAMIAAGLVPDPLYGELARVTGSPVVELQRAAVIRRIGPAAGSSCP